MLSRIIYGTETIREIKLAKNNNEFDEGILYYKKKTDTSLMLYDSSFCGRLSCELQVQLPTIFLVVIRFIFSTSVLHIFATRMDQ